MTVASPAAEGSRGTGAMAVGLSSPSALDQVHCQVVCELSFTCAETLGLGGLGLPHNTEPVPGMG